MELENTPETPEAPLDRRAALENAFEATETEVKAAEPIEPAVEAVKEEAEKEPVVAAKDVNTEIEETVEKKVPDGEYIPHDDRRPTTWKKEYLPTWDKLTKGEALTPEESKALAKYSNQREAEYKRGVSVYKGEADKAKEFYAVLEPVMPELQKNSIAPAQFVKNMTQAHLALTTAPYEQKLQIFQHLARDYGVDLSTAQHAPVQQDPRQQQILQQLNQMGLELNTIKQREQQQQESMLQSEIERIATNEKKYPHFEALREDMAQLLERGLATDLDSAYTKAVRLNDNIWSLEQERLLQKAQTTQSKQQQVAKAKSAAVSVKSITPSGAGRASDGKTDRRSVIEAQLDGLTSQM